LKRFWHEARLLEEQGTYSIALDGKPMRLPNGPPLTLTRRALAEAVAAEWQQAGGGHGGDWSVEDLPLTRLAATAEHRIAPDPAPTAAALARYAEHDLLCYRAAHPEELAVRQHHAWQPWLDWAATTHGARLTITHAVMPVAQTADALAALHAATARLDPFQLTALGVLVPAYGSLVLGLAVAAGAIPALDALRLAMLDELFQEAKWGEDADAIARRAYVVADVGQAARFMELATKDESTSF
jgi:chaperone required for assembly of F1-ATPase